MAGFSPGGVHLGFSGEGKADRSFRDGVPSAIPIRPARGRRQVD